MSGCNCTGRCRTTGYCHAANVMPYSPLFSLHNPRMPNLSPHKCPVCDGEGERLDKDKIEMIKCKACMNGIVWG